MRLVNRSTKRNNGLVAQTKLWTVLDNKTYNMVVEPFETIPNHPENVRRLQ